MGTGFAKPANEKIKEYPCDVMRISKAPLAGKICQELNAGKVIVTTCLNTKCTTSKKSIVSREKSSCDDSSPSTPGFASGNKVSSEIYEYVLEDVANRTKLELSTVIGASNEIDIKDERNYFSIKANSKDSTKEVEGKIESALKSFDVTDFIKEEKKLPVAVFYVDKQEGNRREVLSFKYSSQGAWTKAMAMEALDECR